MTDDADAFMDPWMTVPLADGEVVLFGFATAHPLTGGLSWVRSTPLRETDERAGRARTASGRRYRLGRRLELADLQDLEEGWIAFDLLVRDDALAPDDLPRRSADPDGDAAWCMTRKWARHLGLEPPPRLPREVEKWMREHQADYVMARAFGPPRGRA